MRRLCLLIALAGWPGAALGDDPGTATPAPRQDPSFHPLETTSLEPWTPLTLEDESRLRDLLWRRVIRLASRPRNSDLEEPGLAPIQAGQAFRTEGDSVCTAMLLVEGADEAGLMGPDGRETTEKVLDRDAEALIARLSCRGPCRSWPRIPPAPDASRDPGRGLFLVLPSLPDQPVLSPTVCLGAEASPFPGLFGVAGRLPPGTILFDPNGALVGIVVRHHPQRADRSLAAPPSACQGRSAPRTGTTVDGGAR